MGDSRLEGDEFSTVPTYSVQPRPGEEQLATGPSPLYSRALPTATFKTTVSNISLTLYQQEAEAAQPTFTQQSVISGELNQEVYKLGSVAEVSIKFEGRMNIENAETGARKVKMVDDVHIIWKRSGSSSTCPSSISFCFPFPTSYTDEGSIHPLPPSYVLNVPRVSGTNGQIDYTLVITITKKSLFKQTKSIRVPIIYAPRSRPRNPQPVVPSHVPSIDDPQWKHLSSNLKTTSNAGPFVCTLILPAARVFGVEDTIPFFLQLKGPSIVLQSLLPSGNDLAQTSSPAISSAGGNGKALVKARVVVSISRRYLVTVMDDTSKRDRLLGYGTLQPLPPSSDSPESYSWSGEIKPDERVSVGGFKSGPLKVQDSIVIALNPPDVNSYMKPHEARHNILLVTDSYEDSGQKRRGYEELHAPQGDRGVRRFASDFITATAWGSLG